MAESTFWPASKTSLRPICTSSFWTTSFRFLSRISLRSSCRFFREGDIPGLFDAAVFAGAAFRVFFAAFFGFAAFFFFAFFFTAMLSSLPGQDGRRLRGPLFRCRPRRLPASAPHYSYLLKQIQDNLSG